MYVKIYSYNVDLINEFVKLLKKEAKNCNIKDLKGPIFLPVNKKKYSVLRSPHIFSKSKEQFEIRTFKYLFKVPLRNNLTISCSEFQESLKNKLVAGIGLKFIVK